MKNKYIGTLEELFNVLQELKEKGLDNKTPIRFTIDNLKEVKRVIKENQVKGNEQIPLKNVFMSVTEDFKNIEIKLWIMNF